MMSPASSKTTSPGTRSSESMTCIVWSLSTRDLGVVIFWRAAIAFSALASWKTPKTALRMMTKKMIIASEPSPARRATKAAIIRIIIIKSLNCRINLVKRLVCLWSLNLLGPVACKRVAASVWLSPVFLVCNWAKT